MIEFIEFPKIARLSREITVSEKIDGTNAQILIHPGPLELGLDTQVGTATFIRAGSRSRWISTADDNFGFAKWVYANAHELVTLGEGSHFGEWWGSGIQRGYGLPKGEKRLSLFNTDRWSDEKGARPACCHVVPVLYDGMFDPFDASHTLTDLELNGSKAAPGFMNPEGIVIWHTAARTYFKKTADRDQEWKGKAA